MQGTSHRGFALAGAMSINSAIYAVRPQPLDNEWEWVMHAIGTPYSYHVWVTFWQHPVLLLSGNTPFILLYKLTFYLTLIACTMWPDRWERRELADGTTEARFAPHRGPTHSIVILTLFMLVFGFLYMYFIAYIQLYHVIVPLIVLRELCALATGFFLAFVLHILADMLTRAGVKVFWPAEKDFGIPPVEQLRPLTGSPGEYAWLWSIIFITGVLFALNIVGV